MIIPIWYEKYYQAWNSKSPIRNTIKHETTSVLEWFVETMITADSQVAILTSRMRKAILNKWDYVPSLPVIIRAQVVNSYLMIRIHLGMIPGDLSPSNAFRYPFICLHQKSPSHAWRDSLIWGKYVDAKWWTFLCYVLMRDPRNPWNDGLLCSGASFLVSSL
jgi:hypothetical protein